VAPSSASEISKTCEVTGEAYGLASRVASAKVLAEAPRLRKPYLPPREKAGLLARPPMQ